MPTQNTLSPETKATCPTFDSDATMKSSNVNNATSESINNNNVPQKRNWNAYEPEPNSPVPSKKAKGTIVPVQSEGELTYLFVSS